VARSHEAAAHKRRLDNAFPSHVYPLFSVSQVATYVSYFSRFKMIVSLAMVNSWSLASCLFRKIHETNTKINGELKRLVG